MTYYEKLAAAARNAFKRKKVEISGGVTISLRELSRTEREALHRKLYICGEDGKPMPHRKGKPDPEGPDWKFNAGVHPTEEWIAATADPQVTVEQLMTDDWPDSVKDMLRDEAMAVNGITLADAVKN